MVPPIIIMIDPIIHKAVIKSEYFPVKQIDTRPREEMWIDRLKNRYPKPIICMITPIAIIMMFKITDKVIDYLQFTHSTWLSGFKILASIVNAIDSFSSQLYLYAKKTQAGKITANMKNIEEAFND